MTAQTDARRRRLVGTLSQPQAAPPPPLAFAPVDDDDETAELAHDPHRAEAMFPLLWDCWHELDASRVERLDAVVSSLGDSDRRWRVVVHKHTTPVNSTRKGWLVVGAFESHTECTLDAIRRQYGPGQYRAQVYVARTDGEGREYQEAAIGFGFGLAAPIAEPTAPAAVPSSAPGIGAAQRLTPAPLPGVPQPLAGASVADQLAYLQMQSQLDLQRHQAEEAREERRLRLAREEEDRKEREEERRRARQREEDDRRDREEDRRRVRQREEDDRREREEEKRERRQRDLEARVFEMREKQLDTARSPIESIKQYKDTIAEVRELFGADGSKDKSGTFASIMAMLGEGLGPHVPKMLEIAGTAINNQQVLASNVQRIALLEAQASAALAAEQYRQTPPKAAPPAPAPAPAPAPVPTQHVDERIKVQQPATPPSPTAPPAPEPEPPASSPADDVGASPAPVLEEGAPPSLEATPASVAAPVEDGELSTSSALAIVPGSLALASPELAELAEPGDGAELDDDDGCPDCEPCPCPEDRDCTCPACPHGYAPTDEDDEQ